MKVNLPSVLVVALLCATQIKAIQIRDIFDAYDEESRKESQNKSDDVDPAQLSAEIAGDELAKEVRAATDGVADGVMLQLDAQIHRPIIDKDGDGVEDNEKYT
jgi:hypothetical protein